MRSILVIFLLIFSTAAGVRGQTPVVLDPLYERIAANPQKHFAYPYYILVPQELRTITAEREQHTILVLPNNTGKISDDFEVHEADVKKRMSQAAAVASFLKVVVLMPVFPRPEKDWRIYTQALDRDSMVTDKKEYRRLDLQLVAMIDDA